MAGPTRFPVAYHEADLQGSFGQPAGHLAVLWKPQFLVDCLLTLCYG
jgi:hypothetical protein